MAKFKTRARAIDMLGRQQIANISTAISELFKNSYDAYADNIEVDYFRRANLFVLRDDGFGMTEDEFTERWLAVGTENKYSADGASKVEPPKGKKIRPMMGEKGIGRLAISTIGSQVLIISRAQRNGEFFSTIAAFLNWRIFESPGIDLEEIEIPVIPYAKGTLPNREDILALVDLFRENIVTLEDKIPEKLRNQILEDLGQFDFDPNETDEDLKKLSLKGSDNKVELSLAGDKPGTHFYIIPVSDQMESEIDEEQEGGGAPPLIKTLTGFTNTMKFPAEKKEIDSSKKNRFEPVVAEQSIRTAFRDHVTSDLSRDLINSQDFFTRDDFKLTDHIVEGTFDDEGNFDGTVGIYKREAIKHVVGKPKGINGKTKCGSFGLKFGYVQGDLSDSSLTKEEFTKIIGKLEKIGGLYIYKDDIRVQPYGNYDYDYLGLEMRRSKSAGHYFFSYRRLFGYVEIKKRTSPELAEKAGREGFIDNEAYKQFRRLLVNLFLQLAINFFREGGKDLGGFKETKAELKKADKIRRDIQKRNNEIRRKLSKDLNQKIETLDGEIPQNETDKITGEFSRSVNSLQMELSPDEYAGKVLNLERSYANKLNIIRNKYYLEKPKTGLDEKLQKGWEYYRNKYLFFEKEVIEEARQKMRATARDALSTSATSSSVKTWVLENSKRRVNDENKAAQKSYIETKNSLLRLSGEVEAIAENFGKASKSLENDLRQNLVQGNENKFHDYLSEFDSRLDELSKNKELILTVVRERATDLEKSLKEDITQYTLDETVAALEEENINLRIRYDESIELAQLGMSVSVVGHEFDNSINDIREAIQRLGNWADAEPELKDLYSTIRRGFDHLDDYLSVFTPLQRRSYQDKVDIKGGILFNYLLRTFSEPLRENEIELKSSDRFKEAVIVGYPSTFYPVFINLVDNAIYWLKDRPDPRKISLDLRKDGSITISDTGPGVHPTDRDFIFEPGFTRKPAGRGLGLKISQEILGKAGYELLLENSPNRNGAVFVMKRKQ